MTRSIVIIILAAVLFGIYFLVDNIKSAYRLMPVSESPTMQVKPFDDWRQFTSKANGFSVMLPADPQHATQTIPIPKTDKKRKYDMYASEKVDGSIFMISVITYPPEIDLSVSDTAIKDVVDEMMQLNTNNKLEKLTRTEFLGHEANDFTIQNPDFEIIGKVVVFGRVLYLLTYVAKNDNFAPNEYQHFIDSFQFIGIQGIQTP